MTKDTRMQLMEELKGNTFTHSCPKCDGPTYCSMEHGKSLSVCWCIYVVPYNTKFEDYDKCLCRTCYTKEE